MFLKPTFDTINLPSMMLILWLLWEKLTLISIKVFTSTRSLYINILWDKICVNIKLIKINIYYPFKFVLNNRYHSMLKISILGYYQYIYIKGDVDNEYRVHPGIGTILMCSAYAVGGVTVRPLRVVSQSWPLERATSDDCNQTIKLWCDVVPKMFHQVCSFIEGSWVVWRSIQIRKEE